jgi:O-acetyl-ADP-ribose deacetylase (regulator of RNase III)
LAKTGHFDVIAHGCNCFCKMKRGIAPLMDAVFFCNNPDVYRLEAKEHEGDINKLGQIEAVKIGNLFPNNPYVVNAYTQYHWDSKSKPLDYDALCLCLKKINHKFKGMHIGLPKIGAGLAGGDWDRIRTCIRHWLCDMKVTVVILP